MPPNENIMNDNDIFILMFMAGLMSYDSDMTPLGRYCQAKYFQIFYSEDNKSPFVELLS